MGKELNSLLPRIKQETKRYYGKRLVSTVVFGSAGRNTTNYESDIDLLIIAKVLPKGRIRRIREFDKVEEKLEKNLEKLRKKGIYTYLSPIFKTREEVMIGNPLFLDMIDDGLILYDRDNFFKQYLTEFKRRLDKLGAKKITQGDRWYWVLKPDYKPGQVFEI